MLKRDALLSTIFMIIVIQAKMSWPLMTSNFLFKFRITQKALKASKLNDIKNEAIKYDVVGIDEGQFFEDIV